MLPGALFASPVSLTPLYVEGWEAITRWGGEEDRCLGKATAFLVGSIHQTEHGVTGQFDAYLVTAWHVLANRHPTTKDRDVGNEVDYLLVHFPRKGDEEHGPPLVKRYDLRRYDDEFDPGTPLWFEHPRGSDVDVAVLHLGPTPPEASCLPVPIDAAWPSQKDLTSDPAQKDTLPDKPLPIRCADRLHIVGYPFGDKGTWPYAIWTSAPIASEPAKPYKGAPCFLVDSRTRKGQSGAPVYFRLTPDQPVWVGGDDVIFHEAQVTALVGLYSGRINDDSDLGMVWTVEAIREVLDVAVASRSGGGAA